MKYEYFLLDADDTIFDFIGAAKWSLKIAFEKFGLEYSDKLFDLFKSKNDEAWREYEKGKFDKPSLRFYRFYEFFKEAKINANPTLVDGVYFDTLCTSSHIIDGAITFLENLKTRGEIYLITNGTTVAQEGRIKASGIGSFLKDVFISDQLGVAKPEKKFFDIVLESIKKEKGKCVVIGDSLSSDIQGANNAGLDCIWFNPYRKQNQTSAQPNYIAENYSEILEIIDRKV